MTEEEVKKVKVNAAKDADTTGGHVVEKDVPQDAKFTDTIATKSSIGLDKVDNIKQASNVDFESHKTLKATKFELGHVKIDNKSIVTNRNGEIEVKFQGDPSTWEGVQEIVRNGRADEYFDIGDQVASNDDGEEITQQDDPHGD